MADIWRNTDLQDLEGEVWKDVVGYEGLYMVSSMGRIKSLERQVWNKSNQCYHTIMEKISLQTIPKRGYPHLTLSKDGVRKTFNTHRLVASAFIPNLDNKPDIDHINTIRTDNRVENLRWVTRKENSNNLLTLKHMSESKKGEKHHMWKKYGKLHHNHKPIVQLSLKGEYIKTWDCAADVERDLKIDHRQIAAALKGKHKSAEKFLWVYIDQYDNTKEYVYMKKDCKGEKSYWYGKYGKEHPNSKPIVQLSFKEECIRTWGSIHLAARELKIPKSSIHHALNGEMCGAGGYKWMYLSEYKGV